VAAEAVQLGTQITAQELMEAVLVVLLQEIIVQMEQMEPEEVLAEEDTLALVEMAAMELLF
jgi:hypothetical protein